MLSPRSRGKGGRRVPWRDGGRRKRKRPEWRNRATHAVDDLADLDGPLAELHYYSSGRSPAESIYLFDQQIAHAGIPYHVELHGSRIWHIFTIRVAAEHAATVQAIIARLKG